MVKKKDGSVASELANILERYKPQFYYAKENGEIVEVDTGDVLADEEDEIDEDAPIDPLIVQILGFDPTDESDEIL